MYQYLIVDYESKNQILIFRIIVISVVHQFHTKRDGDVFIIVIKSFTFEDTIKNIKTFWNNLWRDAALGRLL